MFQKIKKTAVVALTLTLTSQAFGFGKDIVASSVAVDRVEKTEATFEITIENLTQGQFLTAPLIVMSGEKIFKVGEPSSRALGFLAEDGDLVDFKRSGQFETALFPAKGIAPGSMSTYTLKATSVGDPVFKHFSFGFASMLASTNDAFVGLNQERLAGGFGTPFFVGVSRTFLAKVYDAGTERNTESCADIPGPPCGSHHARVTKGSEGVVNLHPGLKLTHNELNTGLDHSALFPIFGAKVTVKRIK